MSPLVTIRTLGVVYIVLGIEAVVPMVMEWMHGRLDLNVATVLSVLLGKGLLERSETARRWGVFIGCVLCVTGAAGALGAVRTGQNFLSVVSVRMDADDPFLRSTATLECLAWALFGGWQARLLTRPAVKEYFATPAEAPRLWVVVVLAAAILAVGSALPQMALDHWLRKIELREATVEVIDAETGQRLNPSITMQGRTSGQLFPQTFLRQVPGDRPSAEIIWVDIRPIEIGVSATGYESRKVLLDNANRSTPVQVKLNRSGK